MDVRWDQRKLAKGNVVKMAGCRCGAKRLGGAQSRAPISLFSDMFTLGKLTKQRVVARGHSHFLILYISSLSFVA
jgi:hypothetical protein